jgi:DNA-binding transcriptional ArsR family regulator
MRQVGDLNRLFKVLADPTRRAVVERLGRGPAATSELARPFEMALPSFLQHLGALEDVGLVTSKKDGRVRTYQLTPQPLQAVEDWMTTQRRLWDRRLDQFDEYVRTLKEPEQQP